MSRGGFRLGIKFHGDLFFDIKPNVSWSRSKDGPLSQHRPSLFENRLNDLSWKYMFLEIAYGSISRLMADIVKRYDKEKNVLEVGKEYWELTIFVNYFFFEARSFLDILQKVNILLYPRASLPVSFNDFRKKSKKHLSSIADTDYRNLLKTVMDSDWVGYLMSRGNEKSLRDLQTHYSQFKIEIKPDDRSG